MFDATAEIVKSVYDDLTDHIQKHYPDDKWLHLELSWSGVQLTYVGEDNITMIAMVSVDSRGFSICLYNSDPEFIQLADGSMLEMIRDAFDRSIAAFKELN